MKYEVIGWTEYDNSSVPSADCSFADWRAILEDVKKNGYCFSGYAHQEYSRGAPVMNDGKRRLMSQRSWGGLMAEAEGYTGPMDYSLFANAFRTREAEKMPPYEKDYIFNTHKIEEGDLHEEFTVEISAPEYGRVLDDGRLVIYDEEFIRFLDLGDTLLLKVSEELKRTPPEKKLEKSYDALYERLFKIAAEARPEATRQFLELARNSGWVSENEGPMFIPEEGKPSPTRFTVAEMQRGWDKGDRSDGISPVSMDDMSRLAFSHEPGDKEEYTRIRKECKRIFLLRLKPCED